MNKFRLGYIAGGYISREFFASLVDATSIFEALNEGSARHSFNLQRKIGQVETQSDFIQNRAHTAHFESNSGIVEFRGYADMWGWGYKARSGSRKEANFLVLDRFVRELGTGFKQVKNTTNEGVHEYFFSHPMSDSMSLRVRSTSEANLDNLENLATILARKGDCEIYHSQVLPFSVSVENLSNPIELKFMKMENHQIMGKGDIFCQEGENRDGVVSRLHQLGYEIVAEKAY